jgi:16S rRNA (uracil1498-N3)-methyltransferase
MPRIYCPAPLTSGVRLNLPAAAARHVQVLRLQPGEQITVFNGGIEGGAPLGGEFLATITRMGRSDVEVEVGAHTAVEREAAREVHLALGMPANERMDWLVEKATELGAASIQPLMTARSVLRLTGERADKKLAHWRGIAVAACEQCGRNRVPVIHPVLLLERWLELPVAGRKLLLALQPGSHPLQRVAAGAGANAVTFLSGPEGGLTAQEEEAALSGNFTAVTLGPRILRAETAPLAALAALTLAS